VAGQIGLPRRELIMNRAAILLLGCLALAARPATAQPDFARGAAPVSPPPPDAAITGAIHSIVPSSIEKTIDTLVRFGTRSTLSSMEPDLPPGQGINASADWIEAQFQAISKQCGGCLEVRRDTFIADPASGARWAKRIPRPTRITNVYAIQRGTDPVQNKRIYLVTGHYDSRNSNVLDGRGAAPGANDDASGVAVSLACARALSKMRFPATLVYAAVAGEEQGLVGSAHLAHFARQQGWQLQAVLNNDIVGGNTTPGDTLQLKDRVRVFSEGIPALATPEQIRHIRELGEESDSRSRELARTIEDVSRTYFPGPPGKRFSAFLVFRPDRYWRDGDQSSFNNEGYSAVRFTEWREDFNHQHQNVEMPPPGSHKPILGDLPRFVDFSYVARVAQLNAATLATLASAPGEPVNLAIVVPGRKLGNTTTLSWEPPAGAGADLHFEVVWRTTAAPDWQYGTMIEPHTAGIESQAAGKPVTVTLPVAMDNVVFGVRSVDAKGHQSLTVVP
jgi:hypothetical protein